MKKSYIPKSVPSFPKFRAFDLKDTNWYYDFYLSEGISPYVDLHPSNMIAWLNMSNDLEISNLNGALLLKYSNPLDDDNLNIIPIANKLTDKTLQSIFRYLKENGYPEKICEIPSKICTLLNQEMWSLSDDRSSYEYILDSKQQAELLGGEFRRHRRCVYSFEKEHENDKVDVFFYEELTSDVKKIFLHHIDTMPLSNNPERSAKNTNEPVAIRKNLEFATFFNKKILIIKINGNVASVAMIAPLDEESVAINHIKVDYSIPFIFKYTNYTLSRILFEKGIRRINIEQDLGYEGIRQFKETLRPAYMLEKKSISPITS